MIKSIYTLVLAQRDQLTFQLLLMKHDWISRADWLSPRKSVRKALSSGVCIKNGQQCEEIWGVSTAVKEKKTQDIQELPGNRQNHFFVKIGLRNHVTASAELQMQLVGVKASAHWGFWTTAAKKKKKK